MRPIHIPHCFLVSARPKWWYHGYFSPSEQIPHNTLNYETHFSFHALYTSLSLKHPACGRLAIWSTKTFGKKKNSPEAASLCWVDGGFKKRQSVKWLIHYQVSALIFVLVCRWEYRELQWEEWGLTEADQPEEISVALWISERNLKWRRLNRIPHDQTRQLLTDLIFSQLICWRFGACSLWLRA